MHRHSAWPTARWAQRTVEPVLAADRAIATYVATLLVATLLVAAPTFGGHLIPEPAIYQHRMGRRHRKTIASDPTRCGPDVG
jgi:hypothetical protein